MAVPNILLFQGAKPMARFNHTDRTLEMLSSFITNQTGVHLELNLMSFYCVIRVPLFLFAKWHFAAQLTETKVIPLLFMTPS